MFDYRKTVDKLINEEIARGEIAGASFLTLHHGREIYSVSLGYADREREIPMKRDTICRLFSMSKPITAAAAMILVERGEMDVWDPVSKFLPEFHAQRVWTKNGTVCAQRDITIWDCLNMTTGIPYPDRGSEPGIQMEGLFQELIGARLQGERVDTREYMRRIAEVPLVFQPGECWMYGLSADILGAVIEVVSEKRFGDFLRQELFMPLEMRDTGFYVPEDKRWRLAQNYEWNQEQRRLIPYEESHLGEYYGEDVAFESGGAGLVSTIEDYSHFCRMLLQKGVWKDERILGKRTVEFMTHNHLTAAQRRTMDWDSLKGHGYGCLMRQLETPGQAGLISAPGEFGWDGWTGNYMTVDPVNDIILLYFIQRCGTGTSTLVRKLHNVTFAYSSAID